MSRALDIHHGGNPTIVAEIPGRGIIIAAGDTVPADAGTGYSPGCLFIHTDGGAGTALYVNEGTLASCDFDAASVA